jgi:hypothetical protein
MVMGLIYLLYSAYFLSADFDGASSFVNLILAVVYSSLCIINLRALTK